MKIIVYTYCSYKFSPVGFRHGFFQLDTDSNNEEFIIPTTESDIPLIIRNCFVEGLIQKATGKMPETNEYIILLKGLECDFVNEDGMPAKKYGNFAFATTDPITYNNLNNNIESLSMVQLSEAMNSYLIPDSDAGDAAIKIDVKRFVDFILSVSTPSYSNDGMNDFSIISSSSGDKVITTLSDRFPEYSVVLSSGNNYQFKKKSLDAQRLPIIQYIKERPLIAIPVIVALIAAIIAVLILLLM